MTKMTFLPPKAPEGMKKPLVDSYNSTVMEVKWQPPTSPNGPTPSYKVQKTNIALSYPASVVYGTRFPGGGYYAFPSDTVPQNVDFTGEWGTPGMYSWWRLLSLSVRLWTSLVSEVSMECIFWVEVAVTVCQNV